MFTQLKKSQIGSKSEDGSSSNKDVVYIHNQSPNLTINRSESRIGLNKSNNGSVQNLINEDIRIQTNYLDHLPHNEEINSLEQDDDNESVQFIDECISIDNECIFQKNDTNENLKSENTSVIELSSSSSRESFNLLNIDISSNNEDGLSLYVNLSHDQSPSNGVNELLDNDYSTTHQFENDLLDNNYSQIEYPVANDDTLNLYVDLSCGNTQSNNQSNNLPESFSSNSNTGNHNQSSSDLIQIIDQERSQNLDLQFNFANSVNTQHGHPNDTLANEVAQDNDEIIAVSNDNTNLSEQPQQRNHSSSSSGSHHQRRMRSIGRFLSHRQTRPQINLGLDLARINAIRALNPNNHRINHPHVNLNQANHLPRSHQRNRYSPVSTQYQSFGSMPAENHQFTNYQSVHSNNNQRLNRGYTNILNSHLRNVQNLNGQNAMNQNYGIHRHNSCPFSHFGQQMSHATYLRDQRPDPTYPSVSQMHYNATQNPTDQTNSSNRRANPLQQTQQASSFDNLPRLRHHPFSTTNLMSPDQFRYTHQHYPLLTISHMPIQQPIGTPSHVRLPANNVPLLNHNSGNRSPIVFYHQPNNNPPRVPLFNQPSIGSDMPTALLAYLNANNFTRHPYQQPYQHRPTPMYERIRTNEHLTGIEQMRNIVLASLNQQRNSVHNRTHPLPEQLYSGVDKQTIRSNTIESKYKKHVKEIKKAVNDEKIADVPSTLKTIDEEEDKEDKCAICLNDFEENDDCRRLPCFHFYHVACVDTWLEMNKTCPVCRVDITKSH